MCVTVCIFRWCVSFVSGASLCWSYYRVDIVGGRIDVLSRGAYASAVNSMCLDEHSGSGVFYDVYDSIVSSGLGWGGARQGSSARESPT